MRLFGLYRMSKDKKSVLRKQHALFYGEADRGIASGGYLSCSGKKDTKEPAWGGTDREAYRYI